MNIFNHFSRDARAQFSILACLIVLVICAQAPRAAVWNGIEPLKSRRADVERVLGKPLQDQPGKTGTLRFKVAGGTATVAFIDARFVAAHKLSSDLEGTVRQIVLQHDHASDTPTSLGLANNSDFKREDREDVIVFRNTKEGIDYTFVGGKLKTTYYTASAEQFAKAQKGSI